MESKQKQVRRFYDFPETFIRMLQKSLAVKIFLFNSLAFSLSLIQIE